MTYTVLAVDAHYYIAGQLLPPTGMVGRGADRIYLFYQCSFSPPDRVVLFEDGEEVIASHSFPTLAEATAWADGDARRRLEVAT
jgi:hypothetical protein